MRRRGKKITALQKWQKVHQYSVSVSGVLKEINAGGKRNSKRGRNK
jgi:hypothetical protein